MEEKDFIASIKKVKEPRHHEFVNSYDVRDYYTYYKKQKKNLTETKFSLVLRTIFELITRDLLNGKDFTLPYKLGRIEIRKRPKTVKIVDGKLKVNLPVDWSATLKLWYSDESSRKKKKLIRCDNPWVFKVLYNKRSAIYNNKAFIKFVTSRKLKLALRDEIRNNNFDAFALWREN